jgi:UDP-glucuronate 4-epimerase
MDCIKSGKPINVYGFGKPVRDFTFVEDTVRATVLASDRKNLETEPNKIYNVSSCRPVILSDLVDIFRDEFPELKVNMLPLQPGEAWTMWSDSSELLKDIGYQPSTDIRVGTKKFIDWYKLYTNGGYDESKHNNSRTELTQSC